MSITLTCPGCSKRLKVLPSTAADGKFTCPNCDATISVPTETAPQRTAQVTPPLPSIALDLPEDDEQEERNPPRRRNRHVTNEDERDDRSNPRKGLKSGTILLLVVGGVLLLGCLVVGGVGTFIMFAGKNKGPAAPPGDMSLKEFILQKPATPTAVQVDCRLDTHYNYAFSQCAETHYSFRVEGGSPFAVAYVYAPTTSEHGRSLYGLLQAG